MGPIVAKFGGSSVKDAEALMRSAKIVARDPDVRLVVVSATQGTTNHLEELCKAARYQGMDGAREALERIWSRHLGMARELGLEERAQELLDGFKKEILSLLKDIAAKEQYSSAQMDHAYSFGERISSAFFAWTLERLLPDRKVHWVQARDLIKTNDEFKRAAPYPEKIKAACEKHLAQGLKDHNVMFVTQGFIGEAPGGELTTLGREGSDYSAALLGEGIQARAIQIWTDVPGIATTDPRLVSNSRVISKLSSAEATAMARLGAKFFSETMLPAERAGIPVFTGSSMSPQSGGTWIQHDEGKGRPLASLAVMDELTFYDFKSKGPEGLSAAKNLSKGGAFWSESTGRCRFFLQRRKTLDAQGLAKLRSLGELTVLANQSVLSFVGTKVHDSGLRSRLVAFLERRLVAPLNWCILQEGELCMSFTAPELDSTELVQASHDFLLQELDSAR